MAPQDSFYIAWDGREYAGAPPQGWFLAADNRWWPPRELIDGEDDDGPIESEATQPDPPAPEQVAPENPVGTPPDIDPMQDPPASWAPTPTTSPPEEPQRPTQWTPSGGGQRRGRRGKQSKFRLGPILLFFFILTRCNAGERIENLFSAPIEETGFVEASAAEFEGTNGCSPTFLWGSISNANDIRQTFVVTTDRLDGGSNYQSDELSIGGGETRSWVIDISEDDRTGDFCPSVVVWIADGT